MEQRRQVKVDVVKELLKFESIVNEPNKEGLTPLMISLCEENAPIVELLIENGADPLLGCNNYGANLLHVISRRCDKGVEVADVLELLLKKVITALAFTRPKAIKSLIKSPAGVHMFKVNNGNTRAMCEICSKLIKKTPERCQQINVDINFEQISYIVLVFPSLPLSK